ncbi:MAG: HIT domain-containing protein [Anaerolineaceae bacterium]|nr:MAG: HIT domain-containing protein [Anaerolineaceae bacterium]
MKRIWAPWRMAYIKGDTEETGCLFCNRLTQHDGPQNLILYRGQRAFVILNRFPYTNGHMMVVPNEHKPSIEELDDQTLAELFQLTNQALGILRQTYGAENFNIGINIGEASGAGVTDHVHLHVVPRWSGDTSFMSTVAETRVLPEALEETFEKLLSAWIQSNHHP